ncbi:Transcriptional regulator, LysR family [Xenorhabdus poinarii G6]|uniref:Transcriptional regulator, LysR family n=1 Tax=Xenorhabdus poinarii G6 TaxID=1354304 RepID=A0A068R4H4_9GAMM|nr:LysR family transcriptional regulator [Xenorhabdus poinarii]CDG21786.1 Transcriptional regulator, LysR family [Xenorhabdus poinarii G6]
MASMGVLDMFVRVGETRSFTATGRQLGISASAVSKAIGRLEERLHVRLLHRSTRTVNLTPEGAQFLERCRRILCEVEAAENEISQSLSIPSGKLRMSIPSVGMFFMPKLAIFKKEYPDIELDIDCSDRLVDVIEEGFDVVIRTGELTDSRLTSRKVGSYRRVIVGSPEYFQRTGLPQKPDDLKGRDGLLYRYLSTGKTGNWPLGLTQKANFELRTSMVTNTLGPLVTFAEEGLGVACIPDIAIKRQLESGKLISVLDEFNDEITTFRVVWPSGPFLTPKLRTFVDFVVEKLFPI